MYLHCTYKLEEIQQMESYKKLSLAQTVQFSLNDTKQSIFIENTGTG